jgi:S1-C subfamily serine protease
MKDDIEPIENSPLGQAAPDQAQATRTPRLRRFRFGLKSVFVLILGIAIGFSISKWPRSQPAPPVAKNVQAPDVFGLSITEEPRTTLQDRRTGYRGGMRVVSVRPDSPAALAGISVGDILVGLHRWETATEKDIQYVMSRVNLGEISKVKFYVLRGQNILSGYVDAAASTQPARPLANNVIAPDMFGLNLTEEPRSTFNWLNVRYRGGMRVDSVRPNSPAAEAGISAGDILVGLHRWAIASEKDVQYLMSRANFGNARKVKFYVLRGQNTLYGQISVAERDRL